MVQATPTTGGQVAEATPTFVSEELPLVGTPTSVTSQPVATPTRVVSVLPVTGLLANLYVVLAAVLSIPMVMIIIGMIMRRKGAGDDTFRL